MDYSELYRTTKERVLPTSFKEHFKQSKESIEKNINILKNMKCPNHATEGEYALFMMIQIMGDRIFSSINSLSNDIEALYVYHCLNRERFSDIYKTLEKHGIKIENIEHDEGFEWLKNYFKYASETTHD